MGRGVAACSSRSATARSTAASADRDRLGQRAHGLREALPLGRGGLEGDARAAEQLAALREAGLEGAQRGGRLSGVDLGEVQLLAALGERLLAALDARRHLDEAALRGVALGDEFELAGRRPGAAAQHELRQHVAVARDDVTSPASRTVDRAGDLAASRRRRHWRAAHARRRAPSTSSDGEPRARGESADARRPASPASATTISTRPARAARAWASAAMPDVAGRRRAPRRRAFRARRRSPPRSPARTLMCSATRPRMPRAAQDRRRSVLLVERPSRARSVRAARASRSRSRAVEFLAQGLDLGLERGDRRIRRLDRGGERGILHGAALVLLEGEQLGAGGLAATLGGGQRGGSGARARPGSRRGGTGRRRPGRRDARARGRAARRGRSVR